MRYSGIVEGPASPSIIVAIDRNTVLDYKISLRSRVSAMVDLKFRNVPRIDISETYLSVPLSIVDDQSILDYVAVIVSLTLRMVSTHFTCIGSQLTI
jgi:hypothetical protein